MKIPDFVIDSLDLNKLLDGIVAKLETIMGRETLPCLHLLQRMISCFTLSQGKPRPQIRTHNIVYVPIGTRPQAWHMDDTLSCGKLYRFVYAVTSAYSTYSWNL